MTEPIQQQAPFDKLCLEVLKAIGKTLGQMNLYNAAHPAVKAILQETVGMLSEILTQAPEGGLTYSIDVDKIIANGRIVGTMAAVPNSIPNTFTRFKLNSIAFKPGVTVEELAALCQLAAMRPDAVKGVQAADHLAKEGVTHISLNEAVYAKVAKADETTQPVAQAGEAAQGKLDAGELAKQISTQPLDMCVETLVRLAVSDPVDQAVIKETVLQRMREDLSRRIVEATFELKKQKTASENTATRSQAVMGNMGGGVVVVDDQGKVLMMNPEAEELFGMKMADAAGKPLAQNLKEEHLLSISAEIDTPTDREIRPDVNVLGSPDSKRTLRASAAVVTNEAGKPVGMVSAISDKAKQREMDKMEREFVAHVTHELRAPLTSIRAALEILDGMFTGRLQEDEKRMMDNALRNTDRLEELIKGILDFSKIESGQMTIHPKPSDPNKLAKDAVESMQPWAMKKNIKLALQEQPGLPTIVADPSRTAQVIVNLLSNAIKFTPKGGSVVARVAPGTGDQSKFVVFSVADTGPGIPKSEHNRIFEKFVQIASGETHVGGTGLGLAIAKALIHMQKGTMWLESEVGRGTRFSFTLPHYVPPADGAPRAPKPPPPVPWWKKLFGLQ